MKGIEEIVQAFRSAARAVAVCGTLLVVLGLLSVLMPWAAGLAAQTLIGLLVLAAGVTWIAFAFQAGSWGSGLWEALVGIMSVISGVVMLAHPVISLEVLTLVVASYFIATGVLRAVFSFQLRPLDGWGWILFNGITSVVLGVLISVQWPLSGLWAIGTLIGVDMLTGGFSLIRLAASARAALPAPPSPDRRREVVGSAR